MWKEKSIIRKEGTIRQNRDIKYCRKNTKKYVEERFKIIAETKKYRETNRDKLKKVRNTIKKTKKKYYQENWE